MKFFYIEYIFNNNLSVGKLFERDEEENDNILLVCIRVERFMYLRIVNVIIILFFF